MSDRSPTVELAPVFKGLVTGLPAVGPLVDQIRRARKRRVRNGKGYWGGAGEAAYSYGVWLKHAALLQHAGMAWPDAIAEFGPGDCVGVAIAALLSGVQHYAAYDAVPFAAGGRNVALVDEIAALLMERAPRPAKGWPDFDFLAQPGLFPAAALTDARLEPALAEANVTRIRDSVRALSPDSTGPLQYVAPWNAQSMPSRRYDLILSHSVLEYIDDLSAFFGLCARMLRPGGWMSHQVDLSSLGITQVWNGHLAYSDWAWRMVRGGRAWGPNRLSVQAYLDALEANGFSIVSAMRKDLDGSLRRASLAAPFRELSDADLRCGGLFVIARSKAD